MIELVQAITPIWALILVVAGVAGTYAWRRRNASAQPLRELPKSDELLLLEDDRRILDMQPGDVIDYYDETFLLDGRLLYDEEGVVWKTYLLGDAKDGRDRWLSVDDDDRLEIALYEVLPPGSVSVGDSAPPQLQVGEVTFHLKEKGSARVRKHDDKGTRDRGTCRYADYRGPDDARLSVEWWGDVPEVALGKPVREDELMILPGS